MSNTHQQYLGDGVYASFDGYQVWLAANHHTNTVIALDVHVMSELAAYAKMVYAQQKGELS
jgi:hypothetical protein